MLNLSSLSLIPKETVSIRGMEVEVRGLSAHDVAACESMFMPPVLRGRTETEKEVFSADPEFQKKMRRYVRVQMALRAAAAAGITGKDGTAWSLSLSPEQAERLADDVLSTLTETEIGRIDSVCRGLTEPKASDIGTADVPGN